MRSFSTSSCGLEREGWERRLRGRWRNEKPDLRGKAGGRGRLPACHFALRVLFSCCHFPLLSLRPRLCLVDVGSGEAGKVSRGLLVRQASVFLIATPNPKDPLMSSLTLVYVKARSRWEVSDTRKHQAERYSSDTEWV